MMNKIIISSAKLFILILLLKKIAHCKCDNSEESAEVANDNLFDSKNMIGHRGNAGLIRLLNEKKFDTDVIRGIGKEEDVVNHYEDITILDSSGQLKHLKYKSANVPKIPVKLREVVQSDNKVIKHSDIVTESNTQVESTLNSENEEINSSRHKSKFFDELGCK